MITNDFEYPNYLGNVNLVNSYRLLMDQAKALILKTL